MSSLTPDLLPPEAPHRRALAVGALAAVVLAVHALLLASGRWSGTAPMVITAVAAGFAALGWADDRASRGVALRFGVQALLSLVFVCGALPPEVSWPVRALLCLAVMWAVNLFNFMDGADGLAGVQACAAGLGLSVLLGIEGQGGAALAALAIAGACRCANRGHQRSPPASGAPGHGRRATAAGTGARRSAERPHAARRADAEAITRLIAGLRYFSIQPCTG